MFLITDSKIVKSLIEAHERGVEIRMIIDAHHALQSYSKHEALRKAGIKVKVENWAGKMHQKSMVVDDFITVVASTNWTGASEYSNDENMLVIKNKTIANVQEKEFLRLWKSIK